MSKAECLLCEDVVESTFTHDFVTCKCGNMFLDGGNSYLRYGAPDLDTIKIVEGIQP